MTTDLTQKDILVPLPILVCTAMSQPERFNMLLDRGDCLVLISNRYHRQLTKSLTRDFPHMGTISPEGDEGKPSRFRFTEGPVAYHVSDGKVIFDEPVIPSNPESETEPNTD